MAGIDSRLGRVATWMAAACGACWLGIAWMLGGVLAFHAEGGPSRTVMAIGGWWAVAGFLALAGAWGLARGRARRGIALALAGSAWAVVPALGWVVAVVWAHASGRFATPGAMPPSLGFVLGTALVLAHPMVPAAWLVRAWRQAGATAASPVAWTPSRRTRTGALFAVLVVLAVAALPSDEPAHEGRPMAEWIHRMRCTLKDERAWEALIAIGPRAVPPLLEIATSPEGTPAWWLTGRARDWHQAAHRVLPPPLQRVDIADPDQGALHALHEILPRIYPDGPRALAALLRSPDRNLAKRAATGLLNAALQRRPLDGCLGPDDAWRLLDLLVPPRPPSIPHPSGGRYWNDAIGVGPSTHGAPELLRWCGPDAVPILLEHARRSPASSGEYVVRAALGLLAAADADVLRLLLDAAGRTSEPLDAGAARAALKGYAAPIPAPSGSASPPWPRSSPARGSARSIASRASARPRAPPRPSWRATSSIPTPSSASPPSAPCAASPPTRWPRPQRATDVPVASDYRIPGCARTRQWPRARGRESASSPCAPAPAARGAASRVAGTGTADPRRTRSDRRPRGPCAPGGRAGRRSPRCRWSSRCR